MSNLLLFPQPDTKIPNIYSIPTKYRCVTCYLMSLYNIPGRQVLFMLILEIKNLSPKYCK